MARGSQDPRGLGLFPSPPDHSLERLHHAAQAGKVPRSSRRFRGTGGATGGLTWLAGGAGAGGRATAAGTGGTTGAGATGAAAGKGKNPCGKITLAKTRGIGTGDSCGRVGPN